MKASALDKASSLPNSKLYSNTRGPARSKNVQRRTSNLQHDEIARSSPKPRLPPKSPNKTLAAILPVNRRSILAQEEDEHNVSLPQKRKNALRNSRQKQIEHINNMMSNSSTGILNGLHTSQDSQPEQFEQAQLHY
mmetsp:Transcript_12536/g.21109  ORF Transcript_12536/g.21109 Transcript_12536/m.21109 type:complete len:136 (-) Transcript_12536:216-623(-)